jgi:hypothetical protein
MANSRFNLFDLIYFCGERMRQDGGIPQERGKSSGAMMLAFPLLGIIVAILDKRSTSTLVSLAVMLVAAVLFVVTTHLIRS